MASSPGGQQPPGPALPHEPTLTSQPSGLAAESGMDQTRTVTGGAADVSPAPLAPQAVPAAWSGVSTGTVGDPQQVIRHGPGVPALQAGQAAPTAEQVWRTAPPNEPGRPRRLRRLIGPAISIALLVASGVVIYLRLHHGPFGVTGVAITGQVKNGCMVDVTGRISTTGAAGTISYQWIFSSQQAAPQPASQSAAAGQPAVYVTAAIQGQGHGRTIEQVTLQVLGPGHGTASIPVTVSC